MNEDGEFEISDFSNELNTAFEIGAKGDFGALQANITAFYMMVEDLQVARALPGEATTQFQVQNAAEATSWGVEFDATLELTDNLTFGGNIAYTNARFDDFPGASQNCPTSGGTLEPDPLTGDVLCNFGGLPLIFAPDWKGSAYINFDQPDVLGGWDLGMRADMNFSSSYFVELEFVDIIRQDSYAAFGANVSLTSPNDDFTVSLIGRNLTEEHILAWGLQAGPGTFVAPNEPRELLLRLSYRY